MTKYFSGYSWRAGIPRGVGLLASDKVQDADQSYKIVGDPYHKRYSVERYCHGVFDSVPYDSALLDFRHLKPQKQQAWHKETLESDDDTVVCLVRDQNDRLLYVETNLFENGLCRECKVSSPQGLFLSVHRMYYTHLGDGTDGVVLYDRRGLPVMYKRYACDESGVFTDVIEEQWDLSDCKAFDDLFSAPQI